ncbi:helix-turn-helix domain-containing protein [Streptomyces anulatus]|uniref:helix-turn-helix domain-containing protein n=1 Tax=Streptomyces anulatus TaxID=1892 RepID=UPI003646E47E
MGRPTNPVPNPETGVGRLAQHLRDGLARRGLTYRELAVLTRYHPTSLQRAADGKQVPSWKVVEEFAKGCDMTVSQVRRLWLAARRERPGHRVLGSAPGVDQIYDASDLGVHLAALREKKGSPSYRLMEKRAELTEAQFGRLPRSTAQRITARETTPSLLQMQAFLVGCGLPVGFHGPYVQAWQRMAARIGGRAGARFQKELDMSAQDHGVISMSKLVRALGYTPAERIRGVGRPLTVTCDACGALRRIRLDREVQQLSTGNMVRLHCPNCGTTRVVKPGGSRRKYTEPSHEAKSRSDTEFWAGHKDTSMRPSIPNPTTSPLKPFTPPPGLTGEDGTAKGGRPSEPIGPSPRGVPPV